MKILNRVIHKLIVITMITMILILFVLTIPVRATLNNEEFQYIGTTKGAYQVTKKESLLDLIVNALKEIIDWLLGIMTMGIRMVFIGWTSLIELTLSSAIKSSLGENTFGDEFVAGTVFGGGGVTNSSTKMDRDKDIITIESIVFNRVPVLDINIFKFEIRDDVTATGRPIGN